MHTKVIKKEEFNKKNKNLVFKSGNKQVLVLEVKNKIYAIDNRCPHEGYPLSQGSIDGKACVLACNWHNWKFDLETGECLVGGDHVTTYPVACTENEITIDLSPPSIEVIKGQIMKGFKTAFHKREYGRISRELARFMFNNIDPLCAVEFAILDCFEKFEFGMTHAFAGIADWLELANQVSDRNLKLVCLTEIIDHLSFDSLRHKKYPYEDLQISYSEKDLLEAIENEDLKKSESFIIDAYKCGLSFKSLEKVLITSILNHYRDFGHSLIYVVKIKEIIKSLKSIEVEKALVLLLTRSLCYSTKEDLLPEFKNYHPTHLKLSALSFGTDDFKKLPRVNFSLNESYNWLLSELPRKNEKALYQVILGLNGRNLLYFDEKYQNATNNNINDNVGWLDFTHGLTFSSAVREVCSHYPEFWKSGLLQMMTFYGRNSHYTEKLSSEMKIDTSDSDEILKNILDNLFDHGNGLPIFSVHLLKTALCVQQEREHCSDEVFHILCLALKRFSESSMKQKHALRVANQSIRLIEKDFE